MHGNTKYTKENFNQIASEIHRNFYDYSKVDYSSYKERVTIICPLHGEFTQTPSKHIGRSRGCRKCAEQKASLKLRDSKEDFVRKATELYGDRYDYSLVNFENHHSKIEIICKKHGKFIQSPNVHLQGKACRKCAIEQKIKDESFYNFTKDRWENMTKEGYFYLVKISSGTEEFYKVGIAKSIEKRFKYLKNYSYKVIGCIFVTSRTGRLWQVEKDFHMENQSLKYIPKMEICGMTECYVLDDKIVTNFRNKTKFVT